MVNCHAYLSSVLLIHELIQSAEDARATRLKFVYDKNSYKTHLYDEELAQFQVKFIITLNLAYLFHFVIAYL